MTLRALAGGATFIAIFEAFYQYRIYREKQYQSLIELNPDKDKLLYKIQSELVSTYENEYEAYEWNRRVHKYRQFLIKYAMGNVLEIGVGTGRNFYYYQDQVESLTGIDWIQGYLDSASQKPAYKLKKVNLQLQDAREMTQHLKEKYDTIVLTFVLSCTNQPKKILKECHQLIKQNGRVLILDQGSPQGVLKSWWRDLYKYQNYILYGQNMKANITEIVDQQLWEVLIHQVVRGELYLYILKPK